MGDYTLTFDAPAWLALLAALPVLWWLSIRSLAGLGPVRRWLALGLRTVFAALVILALAEPQWVRTSDRMTVMFLVDQSLSIPPEQREAMIQYVKRASDRPFLRPGDRAGLIAFAREAAPVTPPVEESVPVGSRKLEVDLDPEFTDLASAMRMAQATFPEDGAKRVVIVTDGNENLGNALEQAQRLAGDGVGIDVVPIRLTSRAEVVVEKITTSTDVRKGQPFNLRVVLDAQMPQEDQKVTGRLMIMRKRSDQEDLLNPSAESQRVTLSQGKNVFTYRETIQQPDFYRYEARFVPDSPADDALARNNAATTFTHVRGTGQVLLIKDWQAEDGAANEFEELIKRLRDENIEVTLQTSDRLFSDLADLQRYDTIVLANVPRTSGGEQGNLTGFSDEQIEMLVHNTQQMGAGLVMIGGAKAFGSGGWAGTELEKAMPVDFQINNAKVKAVGALAMMMHASEMADGNHWQKKIAQEALKALGAEDYCGVIHWNGNDQWLWGRPVGIVKVGAMRNQMLASLDRMLPGDMPEFDNAMKMAVKSFQQIPDAAVKHMIIISDGDPSDPLPATIQACVTGRVKVTTVAVAAHGPADSKRLRDIANATGGKYYVAQDPRALPKIYQREVRRISRSLVYEKEEGFTPRVVADHEILKGIDGAIPPITGFVLTTKKDQAEVMVTSPEPAGERNNTILAAWVYGLGKTVALTTDAGDRWATSWTRWANYNKLFSQIVRWSMRPSGEQRNMTVATDVKDGKGRVVITALDDEERPLNMLDMSGVVIGPDLKPKRIAVSQTAPGRYVGEFDAADAGSYLVSLVPEPGKAPLLTGLNVGYSAEFRDRSTNEALLKRLVELKPQGGETGKLIDDPAGLSDLEKLLATDAYRRDLQKATSRREIWYLIVLVGGCLFFFDVFVRRVAVSFAWVPAVAGKLRDKVLRREAKPVEPIYLDRLRAKKAEVADELEQRRAATRFEPHAGEAADVAALDELVDTSREPTAEPKKSAPQLSPSQPEDEDFTARLKRAKEQAKKDQRG
jgi:uncharacterized membrane protein/Mg-chelatase subunit ChlD